MNLKELKKEIEQNGGKISNKTDFQYKGKTYRFHFFINDSKQWAPWNNWKREYYQEMEEFEKYGMTKGRHFENKFFAEDFLGDLAIFWWFFKILFFHILLVIFYPIFKKLYYQKIRKYVDSFKKRIDELDKWVAIYPRKTKATQEVSLIKKLDWSFNRIMVLDWSIRKNKKNIFDIEKYKAIKIICENHLLGVSERTKSENIIKKRERKGFLIAFLIFLILIIPTLIVLWHFYI